MNIDKDNPYASFIVSVLSEKLLQISSNSAQKISYSNSIEPDFIYYNTAPTDDHVDDTIDCIGLKTAIKVLLDEGADLLYVVDNTKTLLAVLLGNKSFNNEIKDMIVQYVDVEKLMKLPEKWINNIYFNLSIQDNAKYLETFIEKGLCFKQRQFYSDKDYSDIEEVSALKYGNLNFFEILLSLNPIEINFDHVYTFKEDYADSPKDDAQQITLRSEIDRYLNANIVQIGTNCYNTAKFLSKYLLHNDLQHKLSTKVENNKKIKI